MDPFDDQHLVAVFSQHSTSPEGIHHSLNSGLDWVQTDATFTNYQGGIRFNPAAQGWVYLGGGHYSDDGGVTWSTNAAYDCLEIDASGAGYRPQFRPTTARASRPSRARAACLPSSGVSSSATRLART